MVAQLFRAIWNAVGLHWQRLRRWLPMFERFTDEARQVVVFAQEEGRTLNHSYIGTEHLLLGLLRAEWGVAAEVLEDVGVGLERARAQVVELVGRGDGPPPAGQIPFTPRSKKTLELSLRASRARGGSYIDTEHILLGLLDEDEGIAVRVLTDMGVDPGRIRYGITQRLGGSGDPKDIERTAERAVAHAVRGRGVWPARFWSAINQLGVEVKRDLGRSPDSGDLLVLLSCLSESVAADALGRLGVEEQALDDALRGAREERLSRAMQGEPELARVLAAVRSRREKAIREGDGALAQALAQVEHILARVHGEADRLDWKGLMERLRRRLGLRGAEPPSEPPAAPGG